MELWRNWDDTRSNINPKRWNCDLQNCRGDNGYNASKVVDRIKKTGHYPTAAELKTICKDEEFGCAECLVIIGVEMDDSYMRPQIYVRPSFDEGEELDERYLDTFYVAQFNPRWKYGTADYVEVVDV
jgi:hypothetical protein